VSLLGEVRLPAKGGGEKAVFAKCLLASLRVAATIGAVLASQIRIEQSLPFEVLTSSVIRGR